jgi:hypothetical protein
VQSIFSNFDPRLKRKFDQKKALPSAGPSKSKPVIDRNYSYLYGHKKHFTEGAVNFTSIKLALILSHQVSRLINTDIVYIPQMQLYLYISFIIT